MAYFCLGWPGSDQPLGYDPGSPGPIRPKSLAAEAGFTGEADAAMDGPTTFAGRPCHTRRFLTFVLRSWSENWPVMKLEDSVNDRTHFRDFPIARELGKAVTKAQRFARPGAFRQWQ